MATKKTTNKIKSTKISTTKKNVQPKKINDHFSIPLVEVKPINASSVNYTYPYEKFNKNQETNSCNNNHLIDELNHKINELNEKNKQWQSKFDSLSNEYQAFKKNVELTKQNNEINKENEQANNNEQNDKKTSFWNRKKEKENIKCDKGNTDDENQANEQAWLITKKSLEDQIEALKAQVESERIKMVEKIQEKSNEAKKILDEKINALEIQKNEEIATNKYKVFESIINSFLDPYIIFKKTLESITDPQLNNYLQGFRMISNMIKDNLINLGVEEIAVKVGDLFNENYMVAFDVVENPQFKHNQVVQIVNPGFVFSVNQEQKVLKFVSVIVAK